MTNFFQKIPFKIFLFFLLCILGRFSIGQNQKLDSLQSLLKKNIPDTTKINVLNNVSKELIIEGKYEHAISHSLSTIRTTNEMLAGADNAYVKTKIFKELSNSLNFLGSAYLYLNDYDNALVCYQRSLKIRTAIGNVQGEITSIGNIGVLYLNKRDLIKAKEYYLKYIQMAESYGDNDILALGYTRLGSLLISQQNYLEAVEYLNKSLNVLKKSDEKLDLADCYLSLGSVHYYLAEYSLGLQYYFQALKICEDEKDKFGMAQAYEGIGLIYRHINNFEKAFDNYSKSLTLRKGLKSKSSIASSYNNIGSLFLHQAGTISDKNKKTELYKNALEKYLLSLKIREELDDKFGMASCYNNIGNIYALLTDFEIGSEIEGGFIKAAQDNFLLSLKIREEIGDRQGVGENYLNIGHLLFNEGKYNESEKYLLRALEIFKTTEFKHAQQDTYLILSEVCEKKNDASASLDYYKKYTAVKDSILDETKNQQIEETEAKYKTEKSQKEIVLLQSQNEIKELSISKSRTQNIILLSSIAIIVVFVFLFFRWNKLKQEQRLSKELLKQQELGLVAVIQTQEEERKRISKDLHDGVGQLLTSLKFTWQNIADSSNDTTDLKTKLNSATELLNEVSTEVRSISHQMMPRALSEVGLVAAIEDMLGKSFGNKGIKYEFEYSNIKVRFAENVEIGLYRISQELINNILKHANATEVSVQLFKNNNKLMLIVEDNGKGFKLDDTLKKGQGLMNIETRAKSINGTVNYYAGPEGGTVATISIAV